MITKAEEHADAMLDRYCVADERYVEHKCNCRAISCGRCVILKCRAEDAWEDYLAARKECW